MVTFEYPAVLDDSMNSQLEQPVEYKIDSTVVDFGQSARLDDQDDWGIYPIRPDHYRAPEVVLGCDWKVYDAQGHYDAKAHLAEMIALLGKFLHNELADSLRRLKKRECNALVYQKPTPRLFSDITPLGACKVPSPTPSHFAYW
ncbi:protein kinase [Histoplasma capsulatum var. duboisii H88]|uniref:Protein kinase n=1 Tax=Ajellomyces capsulatus (strain H88) TaxID=544711 RepID=F0UCE4_AJEC8|nr:protein kinase [Histoplasma capsulatum var. duboisii H88]